MKRTIIIIAITLILAFISIGLADPNDISNEITSYRVVNDTTVEKTSTVTWIKKDLESEKAVIVAQRDELLSRINAKYQPLIDEIDAKLARFPQR